MCAAECVKIVVKQDMPHMHACTQNYNMRCMAANKLHCCATQNKPIAYLQVLCTTSTLALGVNLPAHLVIIKGTRRYVGADAEDSSSSYQVSWA